MAEKRNPLAEHRSVLLRVEHARTLLDIRRWAVVLVGRVKAHHRFQRGDDTVCHVGLRRTLVLSLPKRWTFGIYWERSEATVVTPMTTRLAMAVADLAAHADPTSQPAKSSEVP